MFTRALLLATAIGALATGTPPAAGQGFNRQWGPALPPGHPMRDSPGRSAFGTSRNPRLLTNYAGTFGAGGTGIGTPYGQADLGSRRRLTFDRRTGLLRGSWSDGGRSGAFVLDMNTPPLGPWVHPGLGMPPAMRESIERWQRAERPRPRINAEPVAGAEHRATADGWRAAASADDAGAPPTRAVAEVPSDAPTDAAGFEAAGDAAFSNYDYAAALTAYLRAAELDSARGTARYRAAFAHAGLRRFREAADELRAAVTLDPRLPADGPTLDDLFGGPGAAGRASLIGGVAAHARADSRDADRLFLLAAVMHAAEDDRAAGLFEAAWRLTGGAAHLRPYLAADGG